MIDGNQFVGMVTILLGLSMMASSWVNHPFLFQLTIPRMLDQRFGRISARVVIITLGIGFCVLGFSIVMGWVARPSASNSVSDASQEISVVG